MVELAAAHVGSVIAGYAITVVALGGYVASLLIRARRARAKAAAIGAKRLL